MARPRMHQPVLPRFSTATRKRTHRATESPMQSATGEVTASCASVSIFRSGQSGSVQDRDGASAGRGRPDLPAAALPARQRALGRDSRGGGPRRVWDPGRRAG
eukprot:scaffold14838_cov101-Isochrysis_galbana.AAC.2